MPGLFDLDLRARRRDRAARVGHASFIADRLADDMIDRAAMIGRRFERALLIGCPDPKWRSRFKAVGDSVETMDPGPMFAAAAAGRWIAGDRLGLIPNSFDLVVAVGTLDTANDLPAILVEIAMAIRPGGLFLAAMAGGNTLPALRTAMRAADLGGPALPHVHPRIDAAALSPLLDRAGFLRPVVDVDRIAVSYRSLGALVTDLRAMAATNILSERPRLPLGRAAYKAASKAFAEAGDSERTVEIFEILHAAAWK